MTGRWITHGLISGVSIMGNFLRRYGARRFIVHTMIFLIALIVANSVIQLTLINMALADGYKLPSITVPPMEDRTATDEQRDLNEAYNVLFPKCADGSRAVTLPCALGHSPTPR